MDVLSSDENSVVDLVEQKIEISKLYSKISTTLQPREKVIIEMRYGLRDGRYRTQREIAKLLGISRSYVSRIEKRALKKLLKEMDGKNKI
ncbi:sigma-70 family RNA polymerase sigma factor [Clostridium algidicarnis]|nr:sigma-70 family RNA polymerase sigma factor [Clostridium algidicarnis]MBU3193448.1 sigma-70 family RNA polymerase sigma factor [Clostridium algidicarnis]MBU3203147.1 sigma-70 family RNA polymerase sigma factor [Clostridium algidicarnis]MBU3205559.1 sigma-70 family RNA polymerase sigma factor [Clostridium algidicarnis]MBU3211301.1 sigma-70 family RNA polymerase sigma factor [Clostridium algidicarnis]